jgi:hypothetical protein
MARKTTGLATAMTCCPFSLTPRRRVGARCSSTLKRARDARKEYLRTSRQPRDPSPELRARLTHHLPRPLGRDEDGLLPRDLLPLPLRPPPEAHVHLLWRRRGGHAHRGHPAPRPHPRVLSLCSRLSPLSPLRLSPLCASLLTLSPRASLLAPLSACFVLALLSLHRYPRSFLVAPLSLHFFFALPASRRRLQQTLSHKACTLS